MNGYIPLRRTKPIEATFEAAEGAEPFRATIVTSLSFAEIDAIPISGKWIDIFKGIAPYVVEWNALGRNSETGAYEPLPPPAEAGPDVLQAVPLEVTTFLVGRIKTVHLFDQDEQKNASGPSGDTPAGRPGKNSAPTSTTSKAKSRKNQTATT